MMRSDTRNAPASVRDLSPGDHICCIYRTDEEHRNIISAFIKDGLIRNEKVIYILDSRKLATITGYLEDAGVDPAIPISTGQLVFALSVDTYTAGGSFSPDAVIGFLNTETNKALSAGYTALRVTCEMSRVEPDPPGPAGLIEYEINLCSFFETHACIGLCQYDERLSPPAVLLNILLTHPVTMIGTTFYDNFYYIPAVDLLKPDLSAVLFDHWKEGLAAYTETRRRVGEMASFAEQNPQPVCELGRDGDLHYCNPAGTRFFPDVAREGAVHPLFQDYASYFSEFEKNPGDLIRKEIEIGGQWYELVVSYVPATDRIRIYSTDISKRKQVELALKKSEEKFRLLADFTPGWEYWVDSGSRILYVSPSCEVITGYSPEYFYEKEDFIFQILHPADLGRYKIHESWAHNKKDPGEIEFRIIRSDGRERWIRHSCNPIIDVTGQFLGTRVTNQDFT
jgi:PAS domain S-box-containing protein